MKIITHALFILTIMIFVTGCADRSADEGPLPGGWEQASIENEQVLAAAQSAVSEQSARSGETVELQTIRDARSQVVAGMNYQLKLDVLRGGVPATASARVWARLDRTYELTEWSWE